MMSLRLIAYSLVAAFMAVTSHAADYSSDTGSDSKISREKTLNDRDSREKKDSSTRRKSKSYSTGRDRSTGTTDKQAGNVGDSGGLDAALPAPMLFLDWQPPVYKLVRDFGLTGDQGGWINTTLQDNLNRIAQANRPIADVTDEKQLRAYLHEVAEAGAIMGQAQLYLQADVAKIGKVKRDKEGNVEIHGLGQDDLLNLASGAYKRAQKKITDTRIRVQLAKIKANQTQCRFAGSVGQIQCGQTVLSLGTPPVLKMSGLPWYVAEGMNTGFAGVTASYKVASSWSWSKALEDAKSDSRFTKYAKEASTAAEHLEAEGKSFEAAMSRRKAVEQMQGSKQGLSAGKFMPSVH